jgi:hypothetical protein
MIQDVGMSEKASGNEPKKEFLLDKEERQANNTK